MSKTANRTSTKIKAPNAGGGKGFAWGITAILLIAVVVIGVLVWKKQSEGLDASALPQEDVSFSVAIKDNAVVLTPAKLKAGAPVVDIYEDFSCPHCAELNEADHEDLHKALEEGKMTVRFRFLNFLDGSTGASTRAAATALAAAGAGNAKAFWNLHNYMLDKQTEVVRTWTWDDFADAAAVYDLDEPVISSIRTEAAKSVVEDVAKSNSEALQKKIGRPSTPVVFVNGKQLDIKPGPNGKPGNWVPEVVK